MIDLVERNRFRVSERKSVCFVLGFIGTYFILRRMVQRLLIGVVGKLEPLLQRWFQNRGYTICIMAMRGVE